MDSGTADRPRQGPMPALVLAFALVVLTLVPFGAHDLWRSVREMEALRANARCGQTAPPCLSSTVVRLENPTRERRTRMVNWQAVDSGGQRRTVWVLPDTSTSAGLATGAKTAYVVDGEVVALSSGDQRLPTAFAGSHAVVVDAAGLLLAVGWVRMGVRSTLRARRAGIKWTARWVPTREQKRKVRANEFTVGLVGVLTSFVLALDARTSLITSVLILLAGFIVIRLSELLWRSSSSGGRHAAY